MRLPLLSPLHNAAIADSQNWHDNPFVNRDHRRDIKRKQPFKLFAWMVGTMLIVGGFGMWGLWALMRSKFNIPWFLGGDLGTALCILIVGLHVWFVAGASQNRATLMLAQEAHKDTLNSLLLLPMTPFQLLLQVGVYPWLVGMRTALALLPLYALCVGLDGISWLDLGMLYVVFGLVSVSFPLWRRPILSETALVGSPTQASTGTNTALAQTAMGTGQPGTATGMQSNPNNGAGGWMVLFFMLPMFFAFFAFIGGRGPAGMYDNLHQYFPDSLLKLMLPSMLSWPLLIARGLITPLDWFGFPLPPLPFALVFFVLARYLQIVRTSEFLSVGTFRDLAQQPTYLPRRLLEGAVRIAQMFVVTGYLWKWAVTNGGLGFLVQTSLKGNVATGLTGFVYLLLFVTIFRGLYRVSQLGTWQRGIKAARPAVRKVEAITAVRYLAAPFAFFLLFTLVCALFARVNPFLPPLLTLAYRMLVIGLSGMLLCYGASRLFGQMGPVLGMAVVVTWVIALSGYHLTIVQPLAYFSATLGMLYLGHAPWNPLTALFAAQTVWWRWPVENAALGLILALTAVAMRVRFTAHMPENVQQVPLDPTRVGEEAFSDPPLTLKGEKPPQSDTPLALRLIRGVQSVWDNGVMVKELRVRLRGKLEISTVRASLVILIVATLTLHQGLPVVAEIFGGAMGKELFGKTTTGGSILSLFYLVLLFRALVAGFATFQAFIVERDKSTLGFLLLTPMSNLGIVVGKLAGMLIPGGIFLLTIGVWTLILSLINLPELGPRTLGVWGGMMLSALALVLTLGMLTMAIASIFPKIPTQYAGCIWAVLFQVIVQGSIHLGRFAIGFISTLNQAIGLGGMGLWLLSLVIAVLLTTLATILSVYGVRRMRSKDLTFAGAKRES